jgi:hypothetical protein
MGSKRRLGGVLSELFRVDRGKKKAFFAVFRRFFEKQRGRGIGGKGKSFHHDGHKEARRKPGHIALDRLIDPANQPIPLQTLDSLRFQEMNPYSSFINHPSSFPCPFPPPP